MSLVQNKSQTKIFSVAVLAYGVSGRVFHIPFVRCHPGFKLRGVVERRAECKNVQKDYPNEDIISYDSVEAALNDAEVQVVIVNTPSHTHYEFAKQALLHGKNVIVEKPLTQSVKQTKEIFQLARNQNLSVFPYHQMRYSSDFASLQTSLSPTSVVGRPVELHLRWDRYRLGLNPKKWKEDPALPTSGLTYDLAPHLLDQAILLFGSPTSVYKTQGCFRPDSKVDDWFHFHLYYAESQLSVFVSASLLALAPGPAILLHGTKGTFQKYRGDVQERQLHAGILPTNSEYGQEVSDQTRSKLTLNSDSDATGSSLIIQPSAKASFMQYFDEVYSCLCDPTQPFVVSEDQVVTVMEMIERPNGFWARD